MKELETTKRKTKTKRSMVLFVCVQCVPKEIANEYTHSLTNLFILPLFSKHSQLKAPGTEGDEGKATKGVQYRLVVSFSEGRRKDKDQVSKHVFLNGTVVCLFCALVA